MSNTPKYIVCQCLKYKGVDPEGNILSDTYWEVQTLQETPKLIAKGLPIYMKQDDICFSSLGDAMKARDRIIKTEFGA